jgi:fumarate reductase subunit C
MTTTNQRAPLYRPPVSRLWWLHRRSYLLFVLRELSSVFIAWFVIFLLLFVRAVGDDEAAYERFLDWAANPFVVALNVVALSFVLLHAVTWFNLAPHALVIKLRDRRVPPRVIAISQYAAWAVVSAVVAWLLVGS